MRWRWVNSDEVLWGRPSYYLRTLRVVSNKKDWFYLPNSIMSFHQHIKMAMPRGWTLLGEICLVFTWIFNFYRRTVESIKVVLLLKYTHALHFWKEILCAIHTHVVFVVHCFDALTSTCATVRYYLVSSLTERCDRIIKHETPTKIMYNTLSLTVNSEHGWTLGWKDLRTYCRLTDNTRTPNFLNLICFAYFL